MSEGWGGRAHQAVPCHRASSAGRRQNILRTHRRSLSLTILKLAASAMQRVAVLRQQDAHPGTAQDLCEGDMR